MFKNLTWVALFLLLLFGTGQTDERFVQGYVFEDANQNGRFDPGEPPLAGVVVSNQYEVAVTNRQGYYRLPAYSKMVVFVSKPQGYQVPLDEYSRPRFYYLHDEQGTPANFVYPGIAPTGPLPEQVNFPLYRVSEPDTFTALIVGDPQPADSTEIGYFRDDIIEEMLNYPASFYLALGDNVYDYLNMYPFYLDVVARLGIPLYHVPGNHDMNYQAKDDIRALDTFSRYFGPPYYSFNYGKVHFVVLDDVEYQGWNAEKESRGGYRGYLSSAQLKWLEQDLRYVPENHLIVLLSHIPLSSRFAGGPYDQVVNRRELFKLLEGRSFLLSLSGHMHFIERFAFDETDGWEGSHPFPTICGGAGCGAWWSGPKDDRGIPETHCMDGSPNGFYYFTFAGNRFFQRFIPAKYKELYQMRFFSPEKVISQTALATRMVRVNIFNASPDAKVTMRVDEGPPVVLQRVRMKDAFLVEYVEKFRDTLPGWLNGAIKTDHIWEGKLPADLPAGTHRIEVRAETPGETALVGYYLFTVTVH